LPDGGPDPNIIEKTYTIDVITPLFGGGYEAGTVDPDMPIRASSIRGHLRFWWRATRGARYDNVKELRQREGVIWGSMENPSPVTVEVDIRSRGKTYPCAYAPDGGSPRFEKNHPQYVLFPFQGSSRQNIPIGDCTAGISFQLAISYPDELFLEVNAALWAWVNFGGVGARTRRGCGALYCQDLSPPDYAGIGDWYRRCLKKFEAVPSLSRKWPTLPDKILIKNGNDVDALQCWSDVIGLLQTFRQGKNVGRNPGNSSSRPRRSRWPEPESIRRITGDRAASKYQRMEHIPDNAAFPRAEFGLPIVFNLPAHGDPGTLELYPVVDGSEKTRMTSPLILRPLKCSNEILAQLALQLDAAPVQEVVLKRERRALQSSTTIRGTHLATYRNSPMASRSHKGSALEAFLAYAKDEQGFTEVP
jgi:CRISPR-associated protein Cmr1